MNRQPLPNRRDGDIIEFEYQRKRFRAHVGYTPDGKIGEVFLDGDKQGSDIYILGKTVARLISISLQYGAELDVISRTMPRNEDNTPADLGGALIECIAGV